MLKHFNLEDHKTTLTPMSTTTRFDSFAFSKSLGFKPYRSMIGSFLYLTTSRLDILFVVCLCAHFQFVKRTFRYLEGTITLGLWYSRNYSLTLHAYNDADFVGLILDQKSTSGTCHFLGTMLISWFSKKQNSFPISTIEPEYIALGSCCA